MSGLDKALTINGKNLTWNEVQSVYDFYRKHLDIQTLNDILDEIVYDANKNENFKLSEYISTNRDYLLSEFDITEIEYDILDDAAQNNDGVRDRIEQDLIRVARHYSKNGDDMALYWTKGAPDSPLWKTDIQFRDYPPDEVVAYTLSNDRSLSWGEVSAIYEFQRHNQDRTEITNIMSEILSEIDFRKEHNISTPSDDDVAKLIKSCKDADYFAKKYDVSDIEYDIFDDAVDFNYGVRDIIERGCMEKLQTREKEQEATPQI